MGLLRKIGHVVSSIGKGVEWLPLPGANTIGHGIDAVGGKVAGIGHGIDKARAIASAIGHPGPVAGGTLGVPGNDSLQPPTIFGAEMPGPVGNGAPTHAPSLLGRIGSFLGQHGDQILGAAAGTEGVLDARKANQLRSDALGMAKARDAQLAPLRKLGIQQAMSAQAPDLSGIYNDPGNVYSRPLRRMGATP